MFEYPVFFRMKVSPLLFLFLTAGFGSQVNAAEGISMPPKKILLEQAVELPSKNITAKMLRVTFPPGYKTAWHSHKGPGPRYITKGTIKIVERGVAKDYSAGEVFWESGKRMSAQNIGQGEAELVIFELGPGN